MTDDSVPLASSEDSPTDAGTSQWDLHHLHHEDDDSNDFFTTLKQRVARHVYFDQESTNDQSTSTSTTTTRVDTSELLSRCRNFLPLLTDANRVLRSKIEAGENVRIELDSSDEEHDEAIEMNLMFCPPSGDSSQSDEEEEEETPRKKKPLVNIVELSSKDRTAEENVDSGKEIHE